MVEEKVAGYDRPNLHLTADELVAESDPPAALVGVVAPDRYSGPSLAKLSRPATARGYEEGPVEYVDAPLADGQRLACVKQGLYPFHGALLFELLNQMDGVGEDADVLFVLTTNRPDHLEPALAARPGRVDLAIEVPLPDADCRRRLFELYGRGLTVAVADPEAWVGRTAGASGAFIRELLRKAAVLAAEDGGDGDLVVADRHLDEAAAELLGAGGPLTRTLLGAAETPPG